MPQVQRLVHSFGGGGGVRASTCAPPAPIALPSPSLSLPPLAAAAPVQSLSPASARRQLPQRNAAAAAAGLTAGTCCARLFGCPHPSQGGGVGINFARQAQVKQLYM